MRMRKFGSPGSRSMTEEVSNRDGDLKEVTLYLDTEILLRGMLANQFWQ